MDGWRELLEQQPQLIRLPVFLQLEAVDHSEEIRSALRGLFDRAEAAITQGLEDSLGPGLLGDAPAIAHTVMSLLEAVVGRAGLARDDAERDALYEGVKRSIVQVVWSQLPEETRAQLVDYAPSR